MNKLLLTAILLSTTPAFAFEGWVDLHVGSIHQYDSFVHKGEHYTVNGFNPGIGFTFPAQQENVDYRVGVFRNSYEYMSAYAALHPHTSYSRHWAVGVTLGFITGYGSGPADADLMGMVVPNVSYINNSYRVEVSYLYGLANSAIGLTVGFPFQL